MCASNRLGLSLCAFELLETRRLLAFSYSISDLGPAVLSPAAGVAGPVRVNDSFLSGSYAFAATKGGTQHEVGYYVNLKTKLINLLPLNTPGLTEAQVFDMSENGITVGDSNDGKSGGKEEATEWVGTTPADLGAGQATGISSDGAFIAGSIPFKNGSTSTRHAAILAAGKKAVDLGDLGGSAHTSLAYGVNTAGVIVGSSSVGSSNFAPFYYDPIAKKMTKIGTSQTLPGESYAINDTGLVVGLYKNKAFGFDVNTKTLTSYASPTEPGTFSDAFALDINNANESVGATQTSKGVFATLWENGVPSDLNSLIPAGVGDQLQFAKSISDTGEILALGTTATSKAEAFLLYPNRASLSSKGTLTIQGSVAADSVSVSVKGSKVRVNLNNIVDVGSVTQTFVKSHVKRLTITLAGGNDVLSLGAGLPAANIDAGAGNDQLFIRDGAADVVNGGKGTDKAQVDVSDILTSVEQLIP